MCRYALHTYKAHFVCFSCRKAFKKPAIDEFFALSGRDDALHKLSFRWNRSDSEQAKLEQQFGTTAEEMRAEYLETASVCPECGGRMANMGLDFKAPPRADREAWRVASAMYQHGFIFSSCGCSGPGFTPPARLRGMKDFLDQRSRKSDGEKLLAMIAEKHDRA